MTTQPLGVCDSGQCQFFGINKILLDFAIKLGYQRQFDEAYESLTKGCNACHATTDHPFVVIKAPDSAAVFPNQDFGVKR